MNMKIGIFGILLYFVPSVMARVISSTVHPKIFSSAAPEKERVTKHCWEVEKFTTLSECVPCNDFDKKQLAACKEIGNKQLVQCEKSKEKSYISCSVAVSFEKQRFWTFEAVSLAGAILSNILVWWRRRVLNNFHYQRVKRQMSSATV